MPTYNYYCLGTASIATSSRTVAATATLFEVPTNLQTIVSSLVICNQQAQTSSNPGSALYQIGIVQPGREVSYITTGYPIMDRETITFTWGMTLSAGDYILVGAYPDDSIVVRLAFQLFGTLYSP